MPEVAPITTATRSVRARTFRILVGNRHRVIVLWIGPAVVGNDGGPAGTAGILIVGITAETLVKFVVLAQLFAIESDAQPGLGRHRDCAVVIGHAAAFDDVVGEAMIVRVGGERKIWDNRAEVKHGGELDAELAGGVYGDTQLEGFTNGGGFDAGSDAAPESGVEKDDVDGGVKNVGGELFEVDDDRVGRKGNPHEVAR